MIYINATGLVNAMGSTAEAIGGSMMSGRSSGMVMRECWMIDGQSCMVGEVEANLPEIPAYLQPHNSRNNRLLLAALEQMMAAVEEAIARYGRNRVAIVMGTSTSGLYEGSMAVRYYLKHRKLPSGYFYEQQELGNPSAFLADYLGTTGPAYTLSTACSSSSRAIITAQRMLRAGMADAVIAGGADSLCHMTVNGFHSLEALSLRGCRPFATDRDGITIGEGAALLLLTREEAGVRLLGVGESSDAYHISAPHPEGLGAKNAMLKALAQAGLSPDRVGYINLHGTGTALNDQMESEAVHQVFGPGVPCSSTKHLTGHTLGTCGAMEAVLCSLLLNADNPLLPRQNITPAQRDPTLAEIGLILEDNSRLTERILLSNSFAFGGNNTTLILGAA